MVAQLAGEHEIARAVACLYVAERRTWGLCDGTVNLSHTGWEGMRAYGGASGHQLIELGTLRVVLGHLCWC